MLERNYPKTRELSENLLVIKMKKRIFKNKPANLGLAILDITKIAMIELWYDNIKSKYGEKAKFCSRDTGSFIAQIKQEIFT